MKIFLVEDDRVISEKIKESFENWGYYVKICQDFERVVEEFLEDSYNLLILDIGLPFYNGYYWCKEIRKLSNIPIIFLSSASENLNIIMAMDMGADDYITKPFDMEVLLAKVRAVLRRSFDISKQIDLIYHKGFQLNISEMTIGSSGQSLDLTKNEFKILDLLLRNKGRVLTREELMEKLWESSEFIDDNTLSVNIARLRQKIRNFTKEDVIFTKIGVGYYVKKD